MNENCPCSSNQAIIQMKNNNDKKLKNKSEVENKYIHTERVVRKKKETTKI